MLLSKGGTVGLLVLSEVGSGLRLVLSVLFNFELFWDDDTFLLLALVITAKSEEAFLGPYCSLQI